MQLELQKEKGRHGAPGQKPGAYVGHTPTISSPTIVILSFVALTTVVVRAMLIHTKTVVAR